MPRWNAAIRTRSAERLNVSIIATGHNLPAKGEFKGHKIPTILYSDNGHDLRRIQDFIRSNPPDKLDLTTRRHTFAAKSLPPFEAICLTRYTWNHDSVSASKIWDWSRLSRLELQGMPIKPFLETVRMGDFSHLETFRADCEDEPADHDEIQMLSEKFLSNMKKLRILQTCGINFVNLAVALGQSKSTIRSLNLRPFSKFRSKYYASISQDYIQYVARNFRYIKEFSFYLLERHVGNGYPI